MLSMEAEPREGAGYGLVWRSGAGPRPALTCRSPVVLEVASGPGLVAQRLTSGYERVSGGGEELTGEATVDDGAGTRIRVTDTWRRLSDDEWVVDRDVAVLAAAVAGYRLLLEISFEEPGGFGALRLFAPAAMYDRNDLNEDGLDDYVGSDTLIYRDDRLSALGVVGYSAARRLYAALDRVRPPAFDPLPDRDPGVVSFLQRTDIGSLGVEPGAGGGLLVAAYPFVERERSHALLVRDRPAWGAYLPAAAGERASVAYKVSVVPAGGPHEALWAWWRSRMRELAPVPVELSAPLAAVTRARLDALQTFYRERGDAAGFVTNCHPQDGIQLGNIVQFGFTGQNVLNAYCLLRADPGTAEDPEARRKALRVIDFYASRALQNPSALVPAAYDMDRDRWSSWWTGLLLPLAYAEDATRLHELMGPLGEHLRPVIEALRQMEGAYLRCVAEEHEALLAAYALERQRGTDHGAWFEAARRFGEFLLEAQQADGSWYRSYGFGGAPITEPETWFGQTDVQRKSSTATAVPVLLRLHELTGEERWAEAASRACAWIAENFVERIKFNGGIHDSMYAKPQLVDHESIIFAFRALLATYRRTGAPDLLAAAEKAAWLVCSWVWLWDVPLPEESTLRRFGFRTTGWPGCDTPGAGYIHPMGIIAVPDLVDLALLKQDDDLLSVARLLLAACNENVSLPGRDWGYAIPGLQEEGLQVSWCWADDPMFQNTGFGQRGKGEGNKTCYSWISAVTIWADQELRARHGDEFAGRLLSAGPRAAVQGGVRR
jgi:hypothetical protein